MRLAQIIDGKGERALVATRGASSARVKGYDTAYALAQAAIEAGTTLAECIAVRGLGEPIDLALAAADGRILPPLDHTDPAHVFVTGTGLTHLGSAEGRDRMHKNLADAAALTDSMKMFKMGLEGGKPVAGVRGVQPEWFYKGDGSTLVAPGGTLPSPDFALDGGEEPEIVGVYLIGPGRRVFRLGFALGNEFSDHVTEKQNYLFLAHSKLRASSFGPELLLGDLPADIRGTSRIRRNGVLVFDKPFMSGEANMSHSIANLEAHHFKYDLFRRPGDVHVHFFGTATLSFSEGVTTKKGDVFEIAAQGFGLPLVNTLGSATAEWPEVRGL